MMNKENQGSYHESDDQKKQQQKNTETVRSMNKACVDAK